MSTIVKPARAAAPDNQGTKLTCLTCKLKKCVGRCHFERIALPSRAA